MNALLLLWILSQFWNFILSSEITGSVKISSQQKLLTALLEKYDGDGRPSSARSRAVLVSFGAKLVRIISLNERGNTIRSQWWIYQHWWNSDLRWNETKYNNTNVVHVSPHRIWSPDIILYNSVRFADSAEDNDKLGGGTEKYKTKIAVNSSGYCTWMAPAIFKSTCDITSRYFPFDDQTCTLKFASWAFDGSKLDMEIDESETGIKKDIYQNNTEWDMLNVTVERIELKYSCCIHPYPSVILSLHLRRRYYFYMVNLVVPCSLIALMVLLSFILPPESGERIGLGITVLMAMAIFQELTSSKLPVDSIYIPLLAKYYSTAITEIGLALFSTCIILNFYYKRDRMPNWLKPFMFSILGRLVLIKYDYKQTHKKKKKSPKEYLIEENIELSEFPGNPYSGPCEVRKMSIINEGDREENGSYSETEQRLPKQRKRSKSQSSIHKTPLLNDHMVNNHHQGQYIFKPDYDSRDDDSRDDESRDDELANNRKDWQMAAKILDRLVLVLGILISFGTFLAIFLQAPRVRKILL